MTLPARECGAAALDRTFLLSPRSCAPAGLAQHHSSNMQIENSLDFRIAFIKIFPVIVKCPNGGPFLNRGLSRECISIRNDTLRRTFKREKEKRERKD